MRFPALVTLKVRRGVPSLRCATFVREFERTLREACEQRRFRVVEYSIQTDHLHAIVEAENARALARGMKSIGARFARAANRAFRRRGPVLADRYHLRILETPRQVRNALAYTLLNGRRHAAKRGRVLATGIRIDPASSGRWFAGWARFPSRRGADPPCDRTAVARPRCWLLRIGWRRHGLLDPSEIPGRAAHASRRPT